MDMPVPEGAHQIRLHHPATFHTPPMPRKEPEMEGPLLVNPAHYPPDRTLLPSQEGITPFRHCMHRPMAWQVAPALAHHSPALAPHVSFSAPPTSFSASPANGMLYPSAAYPPLAHHAGHVANGRPEEGTPPVLQHMQGYPPPGMVAARMGNSDQVYYMSPVRPPMAYFVPVAGGPPAHLAPPAPFFYAAAAAPSPQLSSTESPTLHVSRTMPLHPGHVRSSLSKSFSGETMEEMVEEDHPAPQETLSPQAFLTDGPSESEVSHEVQEGATPFLQEGMKPKGFAYLITDPIRLRQQREAHEAEQLPLESVQPYLSPYTVEDILTPALPLETLSASSALFHDRSIYPPSRHPTTSPVERPLLMPSDQSIPLLNQISLDEREHYSPGTTHPIVSTPNLDAATYHRLSQLLNTSPHRPDQRPFIMPTPTYEDELNKEVYAHFALRAENDFQRDASVGINPSAIMPSPPSPAQSRLGTSPPMEGDDRYTTPDEPSLPQRVLAVSTEPVAVAHALRPAKVHASTAHPVSPDGKRLAAPKKGQKAPKAVKKTHDTEVSKMAPKKTKMQRNPILSQVLEKLGYDPRPKDSYECPQCPKTFESRHNYRSHLLSHSEEKPYSCDQCGAAFKRSHDLARHRRGHDDDKPFQCASCGKQFSRSISFQSHLLKSDACAQVAMAEPSLNQIHENAIAAVKRQRLQRAQQSGPYDVKPQLYHVAPSLSSSEMTHPYHPGVAGQHPQ